MRHNYTLVTYAFLHFEDTIAVDEVMALETRKQVLVGTKTASY